MAMPAHHDFATLARSGTPGSIDLTKIAVWAAAVIVPWTAIIVLARAAIDAIG